MHTLRISADKKTNLNIKEVRLNEIGELKVTLDRQAGQAISQVSPSSEVWGGRGRCQMPNTECAS